MTVYVDNARIKWANKLWCHLVADSLDELHNFAFALGLKRKWFQVSASYPHYDITASSRLIAISLGAKEGSRAQIISCARKLKNEHSGARARDKTKQIEEQLSLQLNN
ncbi:DUF4031 domain-containing protein [Pseudomonas nicosulfuronedens]|uniref:DUF4031 domain-containing protein n=1 Tax=Pseudomonas nicosulfuronedens TaxID=2571105 RepID=UPI002448846E|nr:DUF4031 domain-containing protein [Pseudomonas nicosulfuronedens]MDH1009615.1 DUF4031 domain-containing protein [Pseudomonas nicosulfuronedens]MDH1980914.1 DUF4031 domain-containing protein [Pseudomonas nicosulfuronedens]MDH2030623.1 DUF4031 domain-containing protein [Pseudomonas nicosulfuronedens]